MYVVGRESHRVQTRPTARGCEPALDVADADSVIVDNEAEFGSTKSSPPEMRKESGGNWDTCSTFVCAPRPRRIEIDTSIIEVDLGPAERKNRLLSLTCIEPKQNEQRQMQPNTGLPEGRPQ
jgi:hypothetical protein